MGIKNYKDLIVWQKSMDLAVIIYNEVKLLPREEVYSLSDQIRRAVISIPSNIAEGQQRNAPGDFRRFLSIAKGSLGELETQIILCEKLGYFKEDKTEFILDKCTEIGKMLNGLINSLQ